MVEVEKVMSCDKTDVKGDNKGIKKVDLWKGDILENVVAGQTCDRIKNGCGELRYEND